MEKENKYRAYYLKYWDIVKDVVDEDGWIYSEEIPFFLNLDFHFEIETGEEVDYENSYEGEWRGNIWRPQSISLEFKDEY